MKPASGKRVERYPVELWQAIAQQGQFLANSSRLFDEGHEWEAKRLATTLRVLGRSSPHQEALLHLLGVRDSLRYASVVSRDDPAPSLVTVEVHVEDVEHSPAYVLRWTPKEDVVGFLPFSEWWDGPALVTAGETFSRWDLIRGPANQNGGAHVDPELDARYAALSRGEIGSAILIGDTGRPVYSELDPVLAAVRAIAGEMMFTLDSQMMELTPASIGGNGPG